MRSFDARDLYAVVGLALASYGLWQIYHPLTYLLLAAVFLKMAVYKTG